MQWLHSWMSLGSNSTHSKALELTTPGLAHHVAVVAVSGAPSVESNLAQVFPAATRLLEAPTTQSPRSNHVIVLRPTLPSAGLGVDCLGEYLTLTSSSL